jgi:nucleoside-diphosphate-sugar epimerase
MKILITGGAGHIGGSLGAALARRGDCQVTLVDNLSTGLRSNLPEDDGNWAFIKADVNSFEDMAAVMTTHGFDYVFHYAAVVGVKRTQENPVSVLRDLQGIRIVLDLCKNTGVKRVFFSSSSEVYGEPVGFPQHEDTTPLNSRLPYAVVKNVGESFCRSYYNEYGLPYTIFRFFNTYGPLQSTDFVISKFIRAALRGDDVTIYGDGSQTRTFCHIEDNVATTLACLANSETVNDTLNVGHDAEISILDLARMVLRLTGSKSKIVHLPPLKSGDMTRRQPNNYKMMRLLGRPLIDLETGIGMLLRDQGFRERLEGTC